ncbi:MAG TPA: hypothetical protein VG759_28265 [Candidatus Angelobacter sp.]|nr:hypothetical protein [Candidatus Angelobacter sp.]
MSPTAQEPFLFFSNIFLYVAYVVIPEKQKPPFVAQIVAQKPAGCPMKPMVADYRTSNLLILRAPVVERLTPKQAQEHCQTSNGLRLFRTFRERGSQLQAMAKNKCEPGFNLFHLHSGELESADIVTAPGLLLCCLQKPNLEAL